MIRFALSLAVCGLLGAQEATAQIDLVLGWPTPDRLYISRFSTDEDDARACARSGYFAVSPGSNVLEPIRVGEGVCDVVRSLDGTSISPDGRYATGLLAGSGPLRIDLQTGEAAELAARCPMLFYQPAVSADGQRIAFSANCRDSIPHQAIYVVPATGGVPVPITREPQHEAHAPAWSRDGNWIAYSRVQPRLLPPRIWEVVVAAVDGSEQRLLARGRWPAWSPDGAWIAYETHDGVGVGIIRSDGSGAREVFRNPERRPGSPGRPFGIPVWSPDGQWIAFGRTGADGGSVWRVNVVTGEQQQLTYPDR